MSFFTDDQSDEIMYFGTLDGGGETRAFFGVHDQESGVTTPSTVRFDAGPTYFMVGELDIDGGEVRLWIDPAFGATPPAPDVTAPFAMDPAGKAVGSVRLNAGGDGFLTGDEVLVGTAWDDVVPLGSPPDYRSEVKLLATTGVGGSNAETAESVFEVNLTTLKTTFIKQFSPVGDANRANWNPVDGLLYHHAGDEAWSNTVTSTGYLDRQYLETYDLDNDVLTPIINANPAPSDPPPNDFPTTGLPAPRPSWVLPDPRRTVDQTDGSWRDWPDGRGENEYHGLRGLTWSQEEQLFYASDEHGLFKASPAGDSLRVGVPDDGTSFKGISFYRDPETGEQTLYAGERKGNFLIHEVDPDTAQIIRSFDMMLFDDNGTAVPPDPNGDGIVSLAQHPVTGELYGLTKNDTDNQLRKLFTLDPNTGIGLLIGTLETSGIDADFASLTFTGWIVGDINGDGEVNGLDVDPFVEVLLNGSTEFLVNLKADMNGDGQVNGLDVDPFVAAVLGTPGQANVPEPSTIALAGMGLLGLVWFGRKRR